MSNELHKLMVQSPPLFTQSRDFHIFMEPYITTLRNHSGTERVPLTAEIKFLHNFSLESLLLSKGHTLEDIWIIQRVNKIEYSHKLDETIDFLLIPSREQLSEFKSIFKNKISK